jgi:RNA polymerase sigma factor (sigma-70 family)
MTDDELFFFIPRARPILQRHLLFKSGLKLSPDDIQDLVQEAFLRLVRQRPYPDPPLPWLYTVVDNLCIDHFRKNSHMTMVSIDELDIMNSGYIDVLEMEAFRKAVMKLSEIQQRILDDVAAGHTQSEIALRYNMPETTVAYHVREAKERIRSDPKLSAIFKKEKK